MRDSGRNAGIVCMLLLCSFCLLWPLESAGSPRKVHWGIGAGLRTPGHDQEVDFTCGPEIQPRARLRLSERFSLEFSGFLNNARTLPFKHVNQTALGLMVMPMYFITPLEYAETSGRTYVGLGPVVRLTKRQGYIVWSELWTGLEYFDIGEMRSNIDDKWDPSFGATAGIGGEKPLGGGKILTIDIRYMYFLDREEGFRFDGEQGYDWFYIGGWFYPVSGEYHGDLVPRKVIAISVGVLF
jgi:hypothetical protein